MPKRGAGSNVPLAEELESEGTPKRGKMPHGKKKVAPAHRKRTVVPKGKAKAKSVPSKKMVPKFVQKAKKGAKKK